MFDLISNFTKFDLAKIFDFWPKTLNFAGYLPGKINKIKNFDSFKNSENF